MRKYFISLIIILVFEVSYSFAQSQSLYLDTLSTPTYSTSVKRGKWGKLVKAQKTPVQLDEKIGVKGENIKRESENKSEEKKGSADNKISKEGEKELTRDPEQDIFQWFSTYTEVINLVRQKGFRTVDFAKFIQESLKAAVSHVDAHSAFFDSKGYKATVESTSGEFSGIGVSIVNKPPEEEALVIIDVIQGGPADKAGLKPADKVVEINSEKLKGLSTDEVINKLKGKAGTVVKLKVVRNKKPLSFTVKRDIIKDQTSLCFYFPDQEIYYLSLKLFTENAALSMEELLKKANEGKCRGLILDLRRNPGGTLDSAIDIVGLFVPKESLVVVTKDKVCKTVSKYFTRNDPVLKSDTPIFILINNFTASAAEILAGCLQYHSQKSYKQSDGSKKFMVFLVGTSTFGKGSVQELIPVKNGCALKLTTMLYFLPDDESIQAKGIKPDFVIKPKTIPADEIKWIQELFGQETALKHHITVKEVDKVLGRETKEPDSKEKKKQEEQVEPEQESIELSPDSLSIEQEGTKSKQEDFGDKKDIKGKDKEKSWKEREKEELALDVQVQACVNMINLLYFAKINNSKIIDTREKTLSFLKSNYLTDEPAKIEKIK